MLSIQTKIDTNGFWYLVEANSTIFYRINYFIVGSQGRFSSGEAEGDTTHNKGWQFCKSNFPILHVGITSIINSETDDKKINASVENAQANDISRRRMIKQTALGLLIGGGILSSLVGNSKPSQINNGSGTSDTPSSSGNEAYSPYESPHNPY